MNFIQSIIVSLVLFHSPVQTTYRLDISINNVPSDRGNILIALYNKEEGFRDKNYTYVNKIIKAKKGNVTVSIDNLPIDNYAIAVFHDPNENGKLDKNLFGVPTEFYGFSNNVKSPFGPPSFDDCKFEFNNNIQITISLH